jgi:hypothetical protein
MLLFWLFLHGSDLGFGFMESCRDLFKSLNILPLTLQYILSLMMFGVKNKDYFISNK